MSIVDQIVYKLPPVEEPPTSRVYAVDVPTLVLIRTGFGGWESADGLYRYADTAQLLATWRNGVVAIPDPSPLELALGWYSERVAPYDVGEVTQEDWDHARQLVAAAVQAYVQPDAE